MSRILQCPISKIDPKVGVVKFEGKIIHYYLYCTDCGLPGSIASTKKKAIGNWNQIIRERTSEHERQKETIRRKYTS